MTTDRETLQIIGSWMEEGRTRLPDHVLDAVLDQLPAAPQRRPGWSARRIADMNPLAKYAIATAAVVVIAIVGFNLLSSNGDSQVGGVASPSAAPVSSPPPLAPTTGAAIEAGRYRWTSPNVDVSFALSEGWTGREDGLLVRDEGTPTDMGFWRNLPRTSSEIGSFFPDACKGEPVAIGEIGDTVDDLVNALEGQGSTDVVIGDIAAGSVAGKRIEISETPGLDRSQCRNGADGPLQVWVDVSGEGFLSFNSDTRAVAYIFDVDGNRLAFWSTFGPDTTEADVEEVDAIVQSFEFSPN